MATCGIGMGSLVSIINVSVSSCRLQKLRLIKKTYRQSERNPRSKVKVSNMGSWAEVTTKGNESDAKAPHDQQDCRHHQLGESTQSHDEIETRDGRPKGNQQAKDKGHDAQGNAQIGTLAKLGTGQAFAFGASAIGFVIPMDAHTGKEDHHTGGRQGDPTRLLGRSVADIDSHGFLCQGSGQKDGGRKGNPTTKVQVGIIDFDSSDGNFVIRIHNGWQT